MTLLATGCVIAAPLSSAQEADTPGTELREQARRRMALRDAMQQIQEARLAYAAKRYTEAVEHYRNALSVLPKAPYTEQQEKFIRDSLSDALIARAIDYRSVGRTQEAIDFLREAIHLSPENQRAKIELSYTEDPVRTNPALSPEHVGDVEEVVRLLTLAQGYYDLGKYDEAIKTYRTVSQYDAYNAAAQRGIEQASRAKSRALSSAHDAARATLLAEVDGSWDALTKAGDITPSLAPEAASSSSAESTLSEVESAHAAALTGRNVPAFLLENASLDEAIEILSSLIKRFEAQGTLSTRHINVGTDFGAADQADVEKIRRRRVNLNLSDVSFTDVLGEVARLFDLEYYYDPTGVKFAIPGQGKLVDHVFTGIAPHVFENLGSSGDEDDEGEEDGTDDEAYAAPSRGMRVAKIDPVAALKAAGITFPKGSGASYHASSRTLRVRNTQNNISRIAEVVHDRPTKDWAVVLNIMVVEVSENDLEDLGFDWLFNMHLGGEMFSSGGVMQPTPQIGMTLGPNQKRTSTTQAPLVTSGLRSLRQASDAGDMDRLISLGSVTSYQDTHNEGSRSPDIFGVRGVWTAADVTMIMRGLSQKKGADFLTNPRLVFDPKTEEAVTFVNVREMFIPQNYDPPEIFQKMSFTRETIADEDVDGDGFISADRKYAGAVAIAVGAQPTDFVRYGVDEENMGGIGTVVRVHKAEPSPDGRTVNMAITTVVNNFEGFIDWGTPIYAAMWTSNIFDSEISQVFLSPNHIFQPIFKRYLTNTNITVANGAVLVMGGMKDARIVRYEDKVPVLGDLPLVGRLFRSEGESSSRRALMIFAKVNIVDPSGRDIRGGEADVATESPM